MADYLYLTRGAKLKCDLGSHSRRLNILEDKGMYIDTKDNYKHPFVTEDQCKVGDEDNITYYGTCQFLTESSTAKDKDPNWLILKKEMPEGEEATVTVQGIKCSPVLTPCKWLNTKPDAKGKMGSEKPFVTTKSYLRCQYGGIIEVVDETQNGMEYDGDKDK